MFPYLCISLPFQDEEERPPARGHAKPLNRDQLIAVAPSAQLQPGPPQGRDAGVYLETIFFFAGLGVGTGAGPSSWLLALHEAGADVRDG